MDPRLSGVDGSKGTRLRSVPAAGGDATCAPPVESRWRTFSPPSPPWRGKCAGTPVLSLGPPRRLAVDDAVAFAEMLSRRCECHIKSSRNKIHATPSFCTHDAYLNTHTALNMYLSTRYHNRCGSSCGAAPSGLACPGPMIG